MYFLTHACRDSELPTLTCPAAPAYRKELIQCHMHKNSICQFSKANVSLGAGTTSTVLSFVRSRIPECLLSLQTAPEERTPRRIGA